MKKSALWTAQDAMTAMAGAGPAGWAAAGVSIDSRTLEKGDLFVAVKGPNFDGHSFVSNARSKGAAAAVVAYRPEGIAEDFPLLLVDDTFSALQRLGQSARARTAARIIAITGSVGKTGAKEALGLALGRQGVCHATQGNLNNHWGLPLSLARMPAAAQWGVLEIGMNHPGEITPLSRMARPHVAVITTVAQAHAAFFASEDAIAEAKAEIFVGLEPGGVAVLNRDNRHFSYLAQAARLAKAAKVIGFGRHEKADVRLLEHTLAQDHSIVRARVAGRSIEYRLGIPGAHWVVNSLAVLAAAAAIGADPDRSAEALADLVPLGGRGLRHRIAVKSGDVLIVDESYNANPTSMTAAISVLGDCSTSGRRIAVLGDMVELGAISEASHKALVSPLAEAGIDLVFTAGSAMGRLWEALPKEMRGGHAADSCGLAPLIAAVVEPGDTVMVKGSALSRMDVVVEALLALKNQHAGVSANED